MGILTGPAGVGKTRLTIQLATVLKASWVIGRLRRGAIGAIRAVIDCSEPTLVVVEANGWRPEIAGILDDLAELDSAHQYPVKLLLVSRHRDWLTYLRSKVRADTAALIDAAKPLQVESVGGPEDLLRWYREAVVTFADLLGRPTQPKAAHGPPTGTTFGDLLSLAYTAVVTSNTGAALSTVAEVADVLAEQERRQWPEPDTTITDVLRMRIAAALILCGADTEGQAATVIARLPELSDASGERLRDLTRWAGLIYPGSDWFSMPSLELLIHGLTVPALRDPTLRKSLTSDLDVLTLARIGSFLIGAGNTYPEAGAWITELLQPSDLADSLPELMFGSAGVPAPPQERTDRLLAALISKVTERTILEGLKPVLSDDIGYPRARIALLQALVVAVRASDSHDKRVAYPADLAAALTELASALHDFGRYAEALAAHEEAVALLRGLAEEQPDRHEHDLARALTDVGDVLRHLGRYADALVANQGAITLLRDLADEQPDCNECDLVRPLRYLGLVLGDVGQYAEALDAHQEAVELARKFANEDRPRQRDLANALDNLAGALDGTGRYAEALAAHEEAVALLKQLADERPARYLPNLADVLTNFGAGLHQVDREDEALAAHEEAVTLLRQFADELPARYQPKLAHALINLAGGFGTADRHREALAAGREAVTLLQTLAVEQPACQRDLARALTTLGAVLRDVGRNDENARLSEKALTTHEQAVSLLRKLAVEQPDRHLPDLAWALINLGAALNMVGWQDKDARRFDEALAAQQEAISLLGELADEYPARYQPDIAYSLRDRAIVLRNQGRQDEALAAYQESRDLYKALTSNQPWHSGDVTKLDQTIRELLRDLGRDEESVKFAL
jgi:tetratricopeptide (TPR) repeat protein